MGINRRTLLRGKTKREPEQNWRWRAAAGVRAGRVAASLCPTAQLELEPAHTRSKVPERVVASSPRQMLTELLKTSGVYLSAAFSVYVDLKKLVSVPQLDIRHRGW